MLRCPWGSRPARVSGGLAAWEKTIAFRRCPGVCEVQEPYRIRRAEPARAAQPTYSVTEEDTWTIRVAIHHRDDTPESSFCAGVSGATQQGRTRTALLRRQHR